MIFGMLQSRNQRISVLKEGGSLNEDTAAINWDTGKFVLVYAQWHHDIKATWYMYQ